MGNSFLFFLNAVTAKNERLKEAGRQWSVRSCGLSADEQLMGQRRPKTKQVGD